MDRRAAKRAACRYASLVLDGVVGTGNWVEFFEDADGEDAQRFQDAVDELTQELHERGHCIEGEEPTFITHPPGTSPRSTQSSYCSWPDAQTPAGPPSRPMASPPP